MLPGSHVLLVRAQDRAEVVARIERDAVPLPARGLGAVGEELLTLDLAHRVSRARLPGRDAVGVLLVDVGLLVHDDAAAVARVRGVEGRRRDARDGGGKDDPRDRPGLVDARDQVGGHALDVVLVAVVGDVGDVAEAVAARQDVVEDALHVHVAVVQRQAPRLVRRHVFQEVASHRVVNVADAGLHAVALAQQVDDDVRADEAGRARDGDGAAARDGRHLRGSRAAQSSQRRSSQRRSCGSGSGLAGKKRLG